MWALKFFIKDVIIELDESLFPSVSFTNLVVGSYLLAKANINSRFYANIGKVATR